MSGGKAEDHRRHYLTWGGHVTVPPPAVQSRARDITTFDTYVSSELSAY